MKDHQRPARPFSVTIIALAVLYVSVTNLLRAFLSLSNWDYLTGLQAVSPAYLAASGLVWSLSGAWLVWGLWRGKAWSRIFILVFYLVYVLYFWIDRFSVPHSALRNHNWQFNLVLQALLLAFVVWTMSRRKTRVFFGEANE